MPKRIQRKRTKGWSMPEGAVYVGRPTKWGNPFRIGEAWAIDDTGPRYVKDAAHAVRLYELHSGPFGNYEWDDEQVADLASLRGKDLACWCPLDQPCHADVLLRIANEVLSDHAETCEVTQ